MRKILCLFLLFACIQFVHAVSNPIITVDNAHQLQALYTVDRGQVFVAFSEFDEEAKVFLMRGDVLEDSYQETFEIWDVLPQEITNTITFKSSGGIFEIWQIPEQSRLVSISVGGAIYIQEYPSGDIEAEFTSSSLYYTSASVSADGSTLVYTECDFISAMQGGCDPTSWYLTIVDLNNLELKNTIYLPHYEEVHELALSANGQYVLVQANTTGLSVWDTNTSENIVSSPAGCRLGGDIDSRDALFISETTVLVLEETCPDHQIRSWNFATNEEHIIFSSSADDMRHIVLSPDGAILGVEVRKGQNTELYLLDFNSGQILTQIETDGYGFDFSPDGRYIVVGRNPSVIYGVEQ